ncbi:hypothetical protein [Micromonospora sp. KLBMP9576]|uniref:hypothetical protein n=1 Tax=Micromonospora sp. KLBMP9576 TaxID=3424769 RepID=UPI003D8D68FB
MIVAAPGSSSRLYGPLVELVGGLFPSLATAHPRALSHHSGPDSLVFCRGFDIPELVASKVVDIGITGYDVCVEWCIANGRRLHLRALPPTRTSFVTYCTLGDRDPLRIYTEYPAITRAWLANRAEERAMRIVRLHGSTEGVIRADTRGAGVLLVTSGETLHVNGLDVEVPLLATDVCVVTREQPPDDNQLIDLDAMPVLGMPSFCAVPQRQPVA